MTAWALVPARGESKSMPLKNLVEVAGLPLLDYGVRAAIASGRFERIICSTEHRAIAERARALGIETDARPAALCGDDTPVAAVARVFLARATADGHAIPDALALVQPTSPFLLAAHVEALLDAMDAAPEAMSGQTVTRCPHNHHAWNQREIAAGRVRFRFASERAVAYNKQAKPALYVFGNLVAARCAALAAGSDFFVEPSVAVEIPRPYDFDLDTADDVPIANALIEGRCVDLPHMQCLETTGDVPATTFLQ